MWAPIIPAHPARTTSGYCQFSVRISHDTRAYCTFVWVGVTYGMSLNHWPHQISSLSASFWAKCAMQPCLLRLSLCYTLLLLCSAASTTRNDGGSSMEDFETFCQLQKRQRFIVAAYEAWWQTMFYMVCLSIWADLIINSLQTSVIWTSYRQYSWCMRKAKLAVLLQQLTARSSHIWTLQHSHCHDMRYHSLLICVNTEHWLLVDVYWRLK